LKLSKLTKLATILSSEKSISKTNVDNFYNFERSDNFYNFNKEELEKLE